MGDAFGAEEVEVWDPPVPPSAGSAQGEAPQLKSPGARAQGPPTRHGWNWHKKTARGGCSKI